MVMRKMRMNIEWVSLNDHGRNRPYGGRNRRELVRNLWENGGVDGDFGNIQDANFSIPMLE